jgi:hypothetical protein
MGHRKEPKFPDGTLGIVLSSSDERKQEDIFHPTPGLLVAVNVNGAPEYGSIVYDLNEDNQPDAERGAYLQSIFRVIKEPFGVENSIAIQLGPSGQSDSGGGLFTDIGDGSNAAVNEIAIGHGSYSQGGCLHVGHANDKHRKGVDADGNPINPLHIFHRFNLYKNKKEDGPLRIETYQRPDQDLNKKIPVHFGWDDAGQDWAWWTTSVIYYPPTPTPVPFPGIPTEGPAPIVVPHLSPTQTPTLGPSVATPGVIGGDSTFSGPDKISGDSRVRLPLRLAFADGVLATAGYAMRAQNWTDNQIDTGVFNASDAGSKKGQTSNPICGIGSSFAAQGGTISASGSIAATNTGGEGDPFVYTQIPRGRSEAGKPTSKFIGGTASGGIVYHPPEVDLRDVDVGLAPDNVTLSTTYILTAPGAYFGCGVPELVNGSIKDGFSWGVDSATGDLIFRTHTASAAADAAIKFDLAGQDIGWRSGTDFYGTLSHNNTAARAYDFPDRTGTVVVVASPQTYSVSNVTTDRAYDANATTLDEIADVLGTLIADLRAMGAVL